MRALDETLSRKIAFAVLGLIEGDLSQNPWIVSRELRSERAGQRAARVGEYRIIFKIDEQARLINILRIAHRRHAYRT